MVTAIALPRILRVGGGASRQLPDLLSGLGLHRPFIVTDAFLAASGLLDPLLRDLASAGAEARVLGKPT